MGKVNQDWQGFQEAAQQARFVAEAFEISAKTLREQGFGDVVYQLYDNAIDQLIEIDEQLAEHGELDAYEIFHGHSAIAASVRQEIEFENCCPMCEAPLDDSRFCGGCREAV